MTQEPIFYLIIGSFMLVSLAVVTIASLRGWSEWIELKRAELETLRPLTETTGPSTASRIGEGTRS